jgi:hypothetical protein
MFEKARVAHKPAKEQKDANVVAHGLLSHLVGVATPIPDLLSILGKALTLLLKQLRHFTWPQPVLA